MAIAVRYQAAARLPAMAILASVAVLIVHLPAFAHRLLDGDEAVYGSIAALVNQGGTLYGDGGVDNKPPGIFWTYAATFDLFGTYQMTAVHLVALVVVAATCVVLFLIGRSISSPRAGLLAATFYGLLTAMGNPRLLAANTELFMTLPLTAAFLLMLRRQWLWSVETLAGYAAGNWNPAVVLDRSQSSLIPFVATAIVLWVAAGSVVARWRSLWPAEKLAVAWLVVSLLGSLAGGHWSWHYFIQVMAPLALLAGLAVDRALDTPRRRWIAAAVLIGLAVPAAGWTSFNFRADPLTYDWAPPIAQHEQVAEYIRTHTSSGDRVFVWGDWPALYVESDRLMSSRFPGFLRGFARASGLPPNNWDTTPEVWPALQSDLERHPPQLIVDTSAGDWSDFAAYPMSDYPVLANLVASSYHPVATIDGVVIYARNT